MVDNPHNPYKSRPEEIETFMRSTVWADIKMALSIRKDMIYNSNVINTINGVQVNYGELIGLEFSERIPSDLITLINSFAEEQKEEA